MSRVYRVDVIRCRSGELVCTEEVKSGKLARHWAQAFNLAEMKRPIGVWAVVRFEREGRGLPEKSCHQNVTGRPIQGVKNNDFGQLVTVASM